MTQANRRSRRARSITVAVAFALLLVSSPRRSQASSDEVVIETGRVTVVTEGFGDHWRGHVTRHAALWTARIEAVLPEDVNISVECGVVELWSLAEESFSPVVAPELWDEGDMSRLFDIVAGLLEADAEARRRALEVTRRPLTVQLAATTDVHTAREIASQTRERLRDDRVVVDSFVDYSDVPNWDDAVWIISERTSSGRRVYQVIVGAFIYSETARRVLERARDATGLRGFVRFL